ncbi:MAG: glycosyltransferase [Myxococcaceae bacterium]|nr:glycosyltransferase [Myxococcaceae bacterium]
MNAEAAVAASTAPEGLAARRPVISVVTPCFNEELNVELVWETVRNVFAKDLPDCDYEHLFCDNASTDGTLAKLRELAAKDPHVRVIVNARNFGAIASIFNGMLATTGDATIVVMCDLQDPPDLLPQFVAKWREGYKVVYGIRTQREESVLLRTGRALYYRLSSWHSEYRIPVGACEFSLLDRKVIEALRLFDDANPYIRGMIPYVGFKSTEIPFVWKKRRHGKSKTNWANLVDIALNGLVSVNRFPLRLFVVGGLLMSFAALLFGLVSLVAGLFFYRQLAPAGTMTIIVGLFFFSGVQLFILGLLGEYIGAIHAQVRYRPPLVEAERINFESTRGKP